MTKYVIERSPSFLERTLLCKQFDSRADAVEAIYSEYGAVLKQESGKARYRVRAVSLSEACPTRTRAFRNHYRRPGA